MRMKLWSVAAVATLALAGCNSSQNASAPDGAASTGTAAQTPANQITGSINVPAGAQLSPQAKLTVSLVDVSAQGTAPLASKTIAPVTLPQRFTLDFDASKVKASDLYVVQAELVDGDRHYTMPLQAPVLTKGNANQVSIALVAQQTQGEKDLAAFKQIQQQIGGMKMTSGTKLEKGESFGWQAFRQAGQIKFIRVLEDAGDKGFTSTDIAYRDAKPWVAVQQKKADKSASPTSVESASWDTDGNLVLKRLETGGKSSELGADAAATLKQQAESDFVLAGGKK